MSRIALISRHHFIRVFHRLVGIPPIRYQWVMRLAYAKRLLVETDMSVIDVCFEAGYNSLGSFTRRFTALVGIPPHHFRMAARAFDQGRLSALLARPPHTEESAAPPAIGGRVQAPQGFDGIIFIGVFAADQVHGLPLACSAIAGPGPYRIASVPDGSYRLNAVAIPRWGRTADYFIHDQALRASAEPGSILVCGGRCAAGETTLVLRGPELTDLPILLALAPLLESKLMRHAYTNGTRAEQRTALPAFPSGNIHGGAMLYGD
jgi:AraC-like DNA-binding protein